MMSTKEGAAANVQPPRNRKATFTRKSLAQARGGNSLIEPKCYVWYLKNSKKILYILQKSNIGRYIYFISPFVS